MKSIIPKNIMIITETNHLGKVIVMAMMEPRVKQWLTTPNGSIMANYLQKMLENLKKSLESIRLPTIVVPLPDPLGTICSGDPSQ